MIYLLIFLAGCFEGMMDTLQFHWSKFKTKHQKCDSWFWNPALSWKNKYKDRDQNNGEKFLFSTTIFVWTTDAWHLFKLLRNLSLFGCLYFVEFNMWLPIICYASNRFGFNLIYKIIYK